MSFSIPDRLEDKGQRGSLLVSNPLPCFVFKWHHFSPWQTTSGPHCTSVQIRESLSLMGRFRSLPGCSCWRPSQRWFWAPTHFTTVGNRLTFHLDSPAHICLKHTRVPTRTHTLTHWSSTRCSFQCQTISSLFFHLYPSSCLYSSPPFSLPFSLFCNITVKVHISFKSSQPEVSPPIFQGWATLRGNFHSTFLSPGCSIRVYSIC